MAKELNVKLGVNTFYGPRNTTEGSVGNFKTTGAVEELVLEITGEQFTGTDNTYVSGTIPAGALPLKAYIEVTEAFTITGTAPTIDIGTKGSEDTHGFDVTEAQALAPGLYVDGSAAGDWANQLAADTTVGVELGGGTPALTTPVGRMKVVITYMSI
jgi:hypothetical protein